VRTGSESGRVQYQGILAQGQTVRANGRRLWLELGAGENLDATLNDRPIRNFPRGTATAMVSAAGLRALSAP
jgi:hypothetical protein